MSAPNFRPQAPAPAPARVAILLAVRDEQERLGLCLDSLAEFREAGDAIMVCDDGSADDSAAIARERGACVAETARRGRGFAYWRCWETAPADASVFLIAQADMVFSPGARRAMLEALGNDSREVAGGFFRHRINSPRRLFWLLARGNEWRASWLGLPYGDQALFFRREALERAGGFPDQERLEDLEVALRLRSVGPLRRATGAEVVISARHWSRRGVFGQTLANWLEVGRYCLQRSWRRKKR